MPRSIWLSIVVFVTALWATVGQADTGWQPIQETIRKSDKDTRQYQAITLDNHMVVLLVSLCLFRIVWIQWVLPLFSGIEGVFILYPVSWALGAGLMILYAWKGKWMEYHA